MPDWVRLRQAAWGLTRVSFGPLPAPFSNIHKKLYAFRLIVSVTQALKPIGHYFVGNAISHWVFIDYVIDSLLSCGF